MGIGVPKKIPIKSETMAIYTPVVAMDIKGRCQSNLFIMVTDLRKWNAKISECKIGLRKLVASIKAKCLSITLESQTVPEDLLKLLPSKVPVTAIILFVNSRPGRVLVFTVDVKNLILRKITLSSFLLKLMLLVVFILATFLGWNLGEFFFPNMFSIPPFLGSMFLGRISDRVVRWFISYF